jgi:hypothetical protein
MTGSQYTTILCMTNLGGADVYEWIWFSMDHNIQPC